jgi:hypothetical protein
MGRKLLNTEEATLAADKWIAAQPKEFFFDSWNNKVKHV